MLLKLTPTEAISEQLIPPGSGHKVHEVVADDFVSVKKSVGYDRRLIYLTPHSAQQGT
jgi:hypothetical protein